MLGLELSCPKCGFKLEDYSHRNSEGLFICKNCGNEFSMLTARKGQGENYRPFGTEVSKQFGGEQTNQEVPKRDYSYDLFQAEMLAKSGKYKDAKVLYDRIIKQDPMCFDAWLGKSHLRIVQQNIVNFYGADINISSMKGLSKTKILAEFKKLGLRDNEAEFVNALIESNNIFTKINSGYAEHAIQLARTPAEKKKAMARYMYLEEKLAKYKKEFNIKDTPNRSGKKWLTALIVILFAGGITLLILKILGVF